MIQVVFMQVVDAMPAQPMTVEVDTVEVAGQLIISMKAPAMRMAGVQVSGFRVDTE